jgi:hypothetical protein
LKNKENVLMADTPQQDSNYCLIDKLQSLNGTIEDFSAGWNGRVENYNQHAGEYSIPMFYRRY